MTLRVGRGERALCESLATFFATDRRRVPLGIGDDAAVLKTTPRTAATCDPVVEGVHFDSGTPAELVGRKAVNRSLSDLAAVGARAEHVLVSVLFPKRCSEADERALFRGIRKAAEGNGVLVVGGDVGSTPGPLTVTVTALGRAPEKPLRRDLLRPGMTLHVTGRLGGSQLGRHLRFVPRLAEGEWLAGQKNVPAGIDISDGLVLDLQTMLRASADRGAILEAAAVPLHRDAHRAARASGRPALWHALQDGEDHELLFAVRAAQPLSARGPLHAVARKPIGRVVREPGIRLQLSDGRRVAWDMGTGGYEHGV